MVTALQVGMFLAELEGQNLVQGARSYFKFQIGLQRSVVDILRVEKPAIFTAFRGTFNWINGSSKDDECYVRY